MQFFKTEQGVITDGIARLAINDEEAGSLEEAPHAEGAAAGAPPAARIRPRFHREFERTNGSQREWTAYLATFAAFTQQRALVFIAERFREACKYHARTGRGNLVAQFIANRLVWETIKNYCEERAVPGRFRDEMNTAERYREACLLAKEEGFQRIPLATFEEKWSRICRELRDGNPGLAAAPRPGS